MTKLIWVLSAIILLTGTASSSFTEDDSLVGKRVRIGYSIAERPDLPDQARTAPVVVGSIVSQTEDSVFILRPGEVTPHAVPLGSIRFAMLSHGTRSHTNTGALVGLSLGALFAYAAWQSSDGPEQGDKHDLRKTVAVISVAGGLLAGMGVGSLIKSEQWEEIPIESLKVRPSLGFIGNRLRFQLSLRF